MSEHERQAAGTVPAESVLALALDGHGGASVLAPNSDLPPLPTWIHLDYSSPVAARWLTQSPLLPDRVRESLLGGSSRPKLVKINGSLLLTLRALNANPGQRPEHMVALRLFINPQLIVSTRHRKIDSVEQLAGDLARALGPGSVADWLVELCEDLTERAGDFIDDLQERILELEDGMLDRQALPPAGELSGIRRQLIVLRRYLAPQRDLFSRLASEKIAWLDDDDRRHLQEIADRLGRWLDDVDASLARTALLADEITTLMGEALNRRTYVMSLMAMIFLPVSFLTGLFGVNLGGIPGSGSGHGFLIFCSALLGLIAALAWWLRQRRWL